MRMRRAPRAQLSKGGMADHEGRRRDGQIYRLAIVGVLVTALSLVVVGGLLKEVKYFLLSLLKNPKSPYVYL